MVAIRLLLARGCGVKRRIDYHLIVRTAARAEQLGRTAASVTSSAICSEESRG